jgi:hypothetical protein
MTDPPPPSNRRQAARVIACFPAYVEHSTASKEVALIADVATSGARLLVAGGRTFAAGEAVGLELHIDADRMRQAKGRVVRIEALPRERMSVWTHEVGVEFEAPIELDDEEQRTIREQCERLGVKR